MNRRASYLLALGVLASNLLPALPVPALLPACFLLGVLAVLIWRTP